MMKYYWSDISALAISKNEKKDAYNRHFKVEVISTKFQTI